MESLVALAKYIDKRGTRAEFAEKIGLSEGHLSLVLKGERGLSLKAAVNIERVTAGHFKAGQLYYEGAA